MNQKPFKIEFCRDLDECQKHTIPGYFCNYAHSVQELRPKYCRDKDECSEEDCQYYHRGRHLNWVKAKTSEWNRLKKNRSRFQKEDQGFLDFSKLNIGNNRIIQSHLSSKDNQLILTLTLEVLIENNFKENTLEKGLNNLFTKEKKVNNNLQINNRFKLLEDNDIIKREKNRKTDGNAWEKDSGWLVQNYKGKK